MSGYSLEAHLRGVALDWISLMRSDRRISSDQGEEAMRRVKELLDDDEGHWPLALKQAKDGLNSAMRQVAHDLIPGDVGE